jgi:hypothetical protein
MFSYDCILATVLLTAPIEAEDLAPHLELVQPTFLQMALQVEILDVRETQILEGLSKDTAGDHRALRQRFDALLSAPRLVECTRFPERSLIEDFLAFNRAYRKELVEYLEMNVAYAEEMRTALNEVDQMHHLWSTLRDARCQLYYVTVRRQSLQHLQDLIGAEAFYRSQLPPHVPLWCFPRLR